MKYILNINGKYYQSLSDSDTGKIILTDDIEKAYKFDAKIYAEVLKEGLMKVFEIPVNIDIISGYL